MIKLSKIKVITTIIAIVIVVITATILYPPAKEFNKTFNDSFVTNNAKTLSKNYTIKINAKISKRYSLTRFHSDTVLVGTITIDNKKYILYGSNLGKFTNNVLFGSVKEKSTDISSKYTLFMFDDLSSIYLSSIDDKQYIAAPAKTINEFNILSNKR